MVAKSIADYRSFSVDSSRITLTATLSTTRKYSNNWTTIFGEGRVLISNNREQVIIRACRFVLCVHGGTYDD